MSEENDIFGGLSHHELLYVWEYLKDFKKGPAAIRAGVNPSWAHVWASKTHKKHKVRAAIDEAMNIRAEETKIDAEWVLTELARLYKTDLEEIINRDYPAAPYVDLSRATPELLEALDSIEIAPTLYGTKVKVNLPSKLKLLETIGKHVGVNAFKEIIEHSGKMSVVFDDQDRNA